MNALKRKQRRAGELTGLLARLQSGVKPRFTARRRPAGKVSPKKEAEPLGSAPQPQIVELRLYIAGQTPKSLAAVSNLKRICDAHLSGRHRITIIDLAKTPHLAERDGILAIPTLVRDLPKPVRKIIGDLSDTDRVLAGLDLRRAESE